MVKKRVFAIASILLITLVAIFIATNVNDKENLSKEPLEATVVNYENKVEYDELPTDCIGLLNDKYALCKKVVNLEPTSSFQYTDSKETSYLYDIKTGERKIISESVNGSVSLNYIIQNDMIFWIEQQVERGEKTSGNWAIKKYNINSDTTEIIDSGNFEDFSKYSYKDIDFSNENMLLPINIDISGNKLVYHRVIDEENSLKFEIVLYDIISGKEEIIATGKNYVTEYYFDVAINDSYVLYNKYHEINIDNSFRNTTYKYCDLYAYDISTKQVKEITNNKFLINLDANDEYFLVAGVPESEESNSFAKMQIVMIDIRDLKEKVVLDYKSPIYKDKEDLQIGNPTFLGNYIAWQDNSITQHMNIYEYKKNRFVEVPSLNKEDDFSIVGVADNSLLVLGMTKDGKDMLYRIKIK